MSQFVGNTVTKPFWIIFLHYIIVEKSEILVIWGGGLKKEFWSHMVNEDNQSEDKFVDLDEYDTPTLGTHFWIIFSVIVLKLLETFPWKAAGFRWSYLSTNTIL